LVVPEFVIDALIDHGFVALPCPGVYPMYVESPYPTLDCSAFEYFWMDECDPWYSGSRPFGKFSQSPANTTFAVVTTPTRSRDERRNFLII